MPGIEDSVTITEKDMEVRSPLNEHEVVLLIGVGGLAEDFNFKVEPLVEGEEGEEQPTHILFDGTVSTMSEAIFLAHCVANIREKPVAVNIAAIDTKPLQEHVAICNPSDLGSL